MVAVVVVNKSCIDLFVDWQPDLSRPDLSYDRCVGLVDLSMVAAAATTAGNGGTTGGPPSRNNECGTRRTLGFSRLIIILSLVFASLETTKKREEKGKRSEWKNLKKDDNCQTVGRERDKSMVLFFPFDQGIDGREGGVDLKPPKKSSSNFGRNALSPFPLGWSLKKGTSNLWLKKKLLRYSGH